MAKRNLSKQNAGDQWRKYLAAMGRLCPRCHTFEIERGESCCRFCQDCDMGREAAKVSLPPG
jgi:hypothetical protein